MQVLHCVAMYSMGDIECRFLKFLCVVILNFGGGFLRGPTCVGYHDFEWSIVMVVPSFNTI